MQLKEVKKVRMDVILISACLIGAAALLFSFTGDFTLKNAVFLGVPCILMAAHWWILSSFVHLLFVSRPSVLVLHGLFSVFPAAFSLSFIYIAGSVDRSLILPAGAGVVALPAACTLYGLFSGISGLIGANAGRRA